MWEVRCQLRPEVAPTGRQTRNRASVDTCLALISKATTMAEETTFALPKIPQLLGEENLEEWKAAIHNHFEWYDILQYLTDNVPQPADDAQAQKAWRQARLKGKITIHSSLNNKTVRDKLKNSGWNPVEDTDPKAIYELVLRVIPSTSEEALSSLYVEFCTLNRAKYDSLTAFQTRVTYLKGRLEALDCLPPEKGNLIVVINALKSTYPDWHNFLMYDFENKDLTWKKLMQDMSKRANHELSEMSLVATKPRTSKTIDDNTNTTANSNPNSKRTRILCKDCNFRHWSDNKWCEQCKQHEDDKWTWCSICNKHHGIDWRRCKAKENTSSNTPSNTPNASAGALNTTTGLPVGNTRLSQMAIKTELFEKRYIDRDSVLLDTACFNHLFNSKRWFIEYEDIDPLSIGASNGGTGAAIGKGTVRVPMLLPNGSVNVLEMPNTMYQPATPCNLISAGQLERNAVVQDGFNKTVCFRDSKIVLGQYTTIDNVFVMVMPPKTVSTQLYPPAFAAPLLKRQQKVDYATMHRRLLHCSHERLIAVAKELGITYSPDEYANFDCEACHASKEKMKVSREKLIPVQFPLHEVHADTIHHSKLGVHNFRYSTHMLDACTSHHWIFFSKNMKDIAEKTVNWGNEIQNLTGLLIHEFFIDGGREFLKIGQWAAEKGIQIRNTPPYTPEPRGRIERAGGVITTMARTAIIDADLPPTLWPYAEAWAVKILNVLPTTANENSETPHSKMACLLGLHKDLLHPFLQHIRIFGATAWLLLKGTQAPAKGDKTAPRAIKGRYLGSASRRGHVVYVWVPQKHQISTARDVTIVETLGDEKEPLEEPEYVAQWESDDDSDNDSVLVKVKQRQITAEIDDANVDCITQVRIQDS